MFYQKNKEKNKLLSSSSSSSSLLSSSSLSSSSSPYVNNLVINKNKVNKRHRVKKGDNNNTIVNPNMKGVHHLSNLNKAKECAKFIQINGNIIENKLQSSLILKNVPFIQTFADDVHEAMLQIIRKYGKNRIIVGCVAWFNSNEVINVLVENAKAVSFVVNNEDYKKWGFGSVNKSKFESLPRFTRSFSQVWGNKIDCEISYCKQLYPPIMAFGVASQEKNLVNASTMHSKYMIICDENDMPWALWSGTNNFTEKSKRNVENAHFFISPEMAMFYFRHFARTFLLSSELLY